jgi:hypothetical protein
VRRQQPLVAQPRVLVGVTLQGVCEEPDREMAAGFVERSDRQPLGVSVIELDHGWILARRAAHQRPIKAVPR